MKQFKTYKCKIKLRPTHEERPLREAIGKINGQIFDLECMWLCGRYEFYEGEYAMGPRGNKESEEVFTKVGISWIASGDVEILKT